MWVASPAPLDLCRMNGGRLMIDILRKSAIGLGIAGNSAVVERDPPGWVVRVHQYAPVGFLAPKTEAGT
jgi:hypothetical protein